MGGVGYNLIKFNVRDLSRIKSAILDAQDEKCICKLDAEVCGKSGTASYVHLEQTEQTNKIFKL